MQLKKILTKNPLMPDLLFFMGILIYSGACSAENNEARNTPRLIVL